MDKRRVAPRHGFEPRFTPRENASQASVFLQEFRWSRVGVSWARSPGGVFLSGPLGRCGTSHSAAGTGRVPEAVLQFLTIPSDFQQVLEGDLKAGRRMTVEYAADRVPFRRKRLGLQIGKIIPLLEFQPAAQVYRIPGEVVVLSATLESLGSIHAHLMPGTATLA